MGILYEPFRLGQIELRNRIVFAPMNTGYEENGLITSKSLAFYRRLARGGVGLIILGDCAVHPPMTPAPAIYDDRGLPGLRQLVDEVHAEGARIGAQLTHHEYDAVEILTTAKTQGREAALKKLRDDYFNFVNHASLEQIRRIQELFVRAALRAQAAGFDLVQIQGDRLIGMFCSPVLNRRHDGYGGSLENRARFALEVIAKIRAAAPQLHIDYRLALIRANPATGGLTMLGKGGPSLEEAQQLAPWLVKAGVDSLLVCQANHNDVTHAIPPAGTAPYGCFVELASIVRQAAGVPVTAVGRIIRPAMAESIVAQGKADLVALGRALLCDPEWALKAEEGRFAEIRECIMCNDCVESLQSQKLVVCSTNGQTGPGVELEIRPAAQQRRVVVVGGGPAGMEAARVAAARGHTVILLERQRSLGGQVRLAALAPNKDEMKRIIAYQMRELPRLWVDVRLGTEATVELIRSLAPDIVIVATGAAPPPVARGLEEETIPTNQVNAWEVLQGGVPVGQNVVIVGGGMVGLNTAHLLAAQGKKVTVLEARERAGAGTAPAALGMTLASLREAGVEILTGVKAAALLSDGVVVEPAGGEKRVITADTVVKAVGMRRPERALITGLQAAGIPFRAVGDCAGEHARLLRDAIHEGFRVGLEIE